MTCFTLSVRLDASEYEHQHYKGQMVRGSTRYILVSTIFLLMSSSPRSNSWRCTAIIVCFQGKRLGIHKCFMLLCLDEVYIRCHLTL
ncbi:hypothetical protein AMTRI_Chr10g250 [Amborella trichopoda]